MAVGLSTTALAAPRPSHSDENISGESVDLENMNLEPLETERKPLKPYEEKHNVDWVTVKDVLAIPFEGVPKAFPPKKIYTWERILPPRCDVSGLERLVVKDSKSTPWCLSYTAPGSILRVSRLLTWLDRLHDLDRSLGRKSPRLLQLECAWILRAARGRVVRAQLDCCMCPLQLCKGELQASRSLGHGQPAWRLLEILGDYAPSVRWEVCGVGN